MGRRMLKWHGRRKYYSSDTPYQPLDESFDNITNTGSVQKRSAKTKGCQIIRESAKSKASISLARRAVENNTKNGQSSLFQSEKGDCSESSFVTISSGELDSFEDTDTKWEDSKMENEQSKCATGNAIRRFSEISKASVGKMSTKWGKIRNSLNLTRKKTSSCTSPLSGIDKALDPCKRLQKRQNLKSDDAMSPSSKNPLKRVKRANSLYEAAGGKRNVSGTSKQGRRSSPFPTGYAKLNNSDSSLSMAFSMENAAHSTLIQKRKENKADERNYGRELQDFVAVWEDPVKEKCTSNKSIGCKHKYRTNNVNEKGDKESRFLKKNKRRVRRNDFTNLRTLSVRSSGRKVELKISLELSDPSKQYIYSSPTFSGESSSKNNSSNQTAAITPVFPKRPLSRRWLFLENRSRKETIDRKIEKPNYDDTAYDDSSNGWTSNTPPNAEVNSAFLSPNIGEIQNYQLNTPPNSKELIVSMAEVRKCHAPRVRKHKGLTC